MLTKELAKALDKYVAHAGVLMHDVSRDSRSKAQYVKALINGWLAEAVVREAILKKIFGRKRVKRVVKRYSVVNTNFMDKGDCIAYDGDKTLLVEIKSSLSMTGMSNPRGKGRCFGFKVNSARLLQEEAKRTGMVPLVVWYIIKEGIFYIQMPTYFAAMLKTPIVNRVEWGKQCYLFHIPPKSKWRKVNSLWTTS